VPWEGALRLPSRPRSVQLGATEGHGIEVAEASVGAVATGAEVEGRCSGTA
jgi:hypothetical protein